MQKSEFIHYHKEKMSMAMKGSKYTRQFKEPNIDYHIKVG